MNMTYPDWMQEAVRIEREMREEIAEEARIERERQEADGRRLGRALPEALAFFDIAIPAQETNRVELDFVAFSLRNFDFEPVCRNEDGEVSQYNFRLKTELLCGPDSGMERSVLVIVSAGEADAIKQARRKFAQIVVDFHHRAALHKLASATMVSALGLLDGMANVALVSMRDARDPLTPGDEFARETTVAAFLEWSLTEEFYEAAKWVNAALEAMLNAPEQAVEEVA